MSSGCGNKWNEEMKRMRRRMMMDGVVTSMELFLKKNPLNLSFVEEPAWDLKPGA